MSDFFEFLLSFELILLDWGLLQVNLIFDALCLVLLCCYDLSILDNLCKRFSVSCSFSFKSCCFTARSMPILETSAGFLQTLWGLCWDWAAIYVVYVSLPWRYGRAVEMNSCLGNVFNIIEFVFWENMRCEVISDSSTCIPSSLSVSSISEIRETSSSPVKSPGIMDSVRGTFSFLWKQERSNQFP